MMRDERVAGQVKDERVAGQVKDVLRSLTPHIIRQGVRANRTSQ